MDPHLLIRNYKAKKMNKNLDDDELEIYEIHRRRTRENVELISFGYF